MDTKTFVRIALMAALIGALGLVPPIFLPLTAGVPISAQTMGVMLAGVLLGGRNGALAAALFMLVVALGLPLLSGGRGGLGAFVAPPAGFLIGFLPGAFVTGLLARRLPLPPALAVFAACLVGGVGVIYACGIVGLSLVTHMPLQKAALVTLAFLPGDLIKAVGATLVALAAFRAQPSLRPAGR